MLRLPSFIQSYRSKLKEERDFSFFLNELTSITLKDNINKSSDVRNDPISILGNGTSLQNCLSSFSGGNDYMVVNRAVLDSSYFKIKPRYYTIMDPGMFHVNEVFDGISVVKKILEETDWPMKLFVPWEHTKGVEWLKSTEYVTVVTVNSSKYFGPEKYKQYCYEHNLAMPNVENVLVACLYISIYLGYRNIFLFGVEHSWTKSLYVDKNNNVCLIDSHFFDKSKVSATVQVKKNGNPFKMHEILHMYADMFEAYWEIREIADSRKVSIINKTPDSMIDAFDKQY